MDSSPGFHYDRVISRFVHRSCHQPRLLSSAYQYQLESVPENTALRRPVIPLVRPLVFNVYQVAQEIFGSIETQRLRQILTSVPPAVEPSATTLSGLPGRPINPGNDENSIRDENTIRAGTPENLVDSIAQSTGIEEQLGPAADPLKEIALALITGAGHEWFSNHVTGSIAMSIVSSPGMLILIYSLEGETSEFSRNAVANFSHSTPPIPLNFFRLSGEPVNLSASLSVTEGNLESMSIELKGKPVAMSISISLTDGNLESMSINLEGTF